MRSLQRLSAFASRRDRRPRLELDDDVARLDEDARDAARIVWARRAANEDASVRLAERLLASLDGAALARPLEDAARRAFSRLATDERAHVEVTHEVLAALGGGAHEAPAVVLRSLGEHAIERLLHDVAVGLVVCESVSASRFASVYAATDLPAFRERIGLFLRDEIAHARLGEALLPFVLEAYAARAGDEAARAFVAGSLESATHELVVTVAHGVPRAALPPPRPQPTTNPGIVEPAVDARALYRALDTTIAPLLDRLADAR